MSTARTPRTAPLEHAARLRPRERIAALGEALLVAREADRDAMALMLVELASQQPDPHGAQDPRGGGRAAGPVELLTRLPALWRVRHSDEAMLALARAWRTLSPTMRGLGAGLGRDRWLAAAARLGRDPEPGARLAAVSIAHDTADPGLGPVVARLLVDEHQAVRKAADGALLRMSVLLLEHLPAALLGEEFAAIAATARVALPADPAVLELERCILLGAIADAAWSFSSHRCRSPLIAALLLMDRAVATPMEREIGARMRRLLSERHHPSHAPLRSVLKRTPCPILRERSLRWLTISPIAGAAIDRLSSADSIEEHEIVLRRAHLALRPRRAWQLATLKPKRGVLAQSQRQPDRGPLPDPASWEKLGHDSRLGLLRLSRLVTLPEHHARELVEPALADPSALVRLIASERCAPADLTDYLYDACPALARHAALRWSSAGHRAPRMGSPAWSHRAGVARLNARSPHAWVRRVSGDEADRITPLDPASPASRVQARRMLGADPTGFVRMVRDRLAAPASRLDALMLVRMLGVEARFELDLIAMVQDREQDPRARATAVMALAGVDSDSARYVLREAINDRDPRTRANAVESVDMEPEKILEYKLDEHHRVRACAIRRVLAAPGASRQGMTRLAGEALLEMLGDGRDEHRLAGAWTAQRCVVASRRSELGGVFHPLVNQIEALGANDPDPRVRARARGCERRIGLALRPSRTSQGRD